MIQATIYFFVISLQLVILIQDLRFRAIHFLMPIFLFLLSIIDFNLSELLLVDVLPTYMYLLICFSAGYLYFVIKNKKWINPFLSIMGVGDVIYFISIVLFFNTQNFVLFFVCALIFSMLGFFLLRFFNENVNTIPLAGLSALFFVLIKFTSIILDKDLFYQKIFF